MFASGFEKIAYTKPELKELIGEHKKLLGIFSRNNRKEELKEALRQSKELKGYKKTLSKLDGNGLNKTASTSAAKNLGKFKALQFRFDNKPKLESIIPQSQKLKEKLTEAQKDASLNRAVERLKARLSGKVVT